jgi:RNA polymerase sigma-70 factor, ECF subfamily
MAASEIMLASPPPAVEQSLEPVHHTDGAIAVSGPANGRDAGHADHADHSSRGGAGAQPWTFDALYDAYATFVWRNACRLGIPQAGAEDVMQEVFLVVYRRLPEFEERTSVRAWLSAILIRVVRAYRRNARRKVGSGGEALSPVDPDNLVDLRQRSPLDLLERDETVRELYGVLAGMNEERREVLVLSELEELTAPEIAQALQVNINTVYWRLRTARKEFERVLFRRRAVEARTPR